MNQIAQQLKEKNIAEYLIYMWQEEDLIRANHCEPEEMEANVIARYPEEQRREKAEICRVASCILILGEESAIISMLSIQQNMPVCRNGRRGGLKIRFVFFRVCTRNSRVFVEF